MKLKCHLKHIVKNGKNFKKYYKVNDKFSELCAFF